LLHLLYSQFVRSRRQYYLRRPEIRRRLASPVISVGNLTIGGSGKTPLVGEIARMLLEMGERPAILSRGYARQQPSNAVVIVSDGTSPRVDVAHAGDEPFLLAREVPGAAVVVHANRYLAGRVAELQLGCTVHLLDDGFQHLMLMRDIDLLVAPPDDFADTRTLPFGRFREPLDAASAADALLVPLDGSVTPPEMAARLNVKTAFGFSRALDPPRRALPAFAFAGIARPERFYTDLERVGWPLTGRRSFPDHHVYTAREIEGIRQAARDSGAQVIVTTAKDAVRLPAPATSVASIPSDVSAAGSGLSRTTDLPIIEIPIDISIEAGFRPWLQERLNRLRAT
jgi:tetraacyldisaccharide 4'-kinase